MFSRKDMRVLNYMLPILLFDISWLTPTALCSNPSTSSATAPLSHATNTLSGAKWRISKPFMMTNVRNHVS